MIAQTGLHCWRDAKALMYPAEIVVHKMESYRISMVFEFF